MNYKSSSPSNALSPMVLNKPLSERSYDNYSRFTLKKNVTFFSCQVEDTC